MEERINKNTVSNNSKKSLAFICLICKSIYTLNPLVNVKTVYLCGPIL